MIEPGKSRKKQNDRNFALWFSLQCDKTTPWKKEKDCCFKLFCMEGEFWWTEKKKRICTTIHLMFFSFSLFSSICRENESWQRMAWLLQVGRSTMEGSQFDAWRERIIEKLKRICVACDDQQNSGT
jgi:hypothetical protein